MALAVSAAACACSYCSSSFHSVLIDIWRGAMADATLIAEDTVERAHQLNGDLPLSVALTVRAAVAA